MVATGNGESGFDSGGGGYRRAGSARGRQCWYPPPPPPPWPEPEPPPPVTLDRETGRARIFGGSVQVMFAWGQRDSFDGTQIVGPLCDQITFFVLL